MMHYYHLLACELFRTEMNYLLPQCKNKMEITFLDRDLHVKPGLLRIALQKEIDRIEEEADVPGAKIPEAILLLFGLCSNAVVGLHSKRIPLVIPRAHDCTTLLMGSKEAYQDYFSRVQGTYYFSHGWMEFGVTSIEDNIARKRQEYMDKYEDDEDTVEYLLEMERSFLASYHCLTCIRWPGLPNETMEKEAQRIARENGWDYLTYDGSDSLMASFFAGDWDEDRYLIVQPGNAIQPSYDDTVLTTVSRNED